MPPERQHVVETIMAECLQAPHVTFPIGVDVQARQHWTKLVQTARVAVELCVRAYGLENLFAPRTFSHWNAVRQRFRVAREARCLIGTELDFGKLKIEIGELLTRVRTRLATSGINIGLFDVYFFCLYGITSFWCRRRESNPHGRKADRF